MITDNLGRYEITVLSCEKKLSHYIICMQITLKKGKNVISSPVLSSEKRLSSNLPKTVMCYVLSGIARRIHTKIPRSTGFCWKFNFRGYIFVIVLVSFKIFEIAWKNVALLWSVHQLLEITVATWRQPQKSYGREKCYEVKESRRIVVKIYKRPYNFCDFLWLFQTFHVHTPSMAVPKWATMKYYHVTF